MKYKLMVLIVTFFSLILFSGCGSHAIVYSDEYVPEQDQQYWYAANGDLSMADSEEGYYFMNGESSRFIYFYDKESGYSSPICNKPECKHNDETCNAFLVPFTDSIKALLYYSDHLYYLLDTESNDVLYEISLDGTGRKELYTFNEYVTHIAMHRGYIYYATTDFGTIPGKEAETETTETISRIPIRNLSAEPEVLYTFSGINANTQGFLCYGNYIYFYQMYYAAASMEQEDARTQMNRYNILNGSVESILEDCYARYTIFNGRLAFIDKEGTYLCDLDGGNIQKVWDGNGILLPSQKYLFIDTVKNFDVIDRLIPRRIAVIDSEGQYVDSIELDGYRRSPIGVVDEVYYIPDFDHDRQLMLIYSIPVDKIADGTGQPELFFEYTGELVWR